MKLRRNAAAALALVALAALAGCGDGDEDRPPAQQGGEAEWVDPRAEEERRPGARSVEADPGGAPVFRPDALRAEAGRVALELVNPSTTAHSLCVESETQGALGCTGTFRGDRSVLRLRLEPGTYTFFCSVPGHKDAGMRGTLTVE
jgi:plastocyanin